VKTLHKVVQSDAEAIIEVATQYLDEMPNVAREWGPVGRLGIPYWYEHAVKIEAYANKDRNHGENEDGFVDMKDGVTKSPEEKYEGDVDKPGDELRDR